MERHFDSEFTSQEHLGKDLMGLVLQELKALPEPWQRMSETKQQTVIDRVREGVEDAVRKAVNTIVSHGRVSVIRNLESVNFKDKNTEAKLIVEKLNTEEVLFELQKSRGGTCLIVLASSEEFTGGMDGITGEPDQRALSMGDEYKVSPIRTRNRKNSDID